MIGPDHFSKLSARLEKQLQMEVYKDALAEVNLIKHNVIQAFLESSADPTVVHNFVNVVSLLLWSRLACSKGRRMCCNTI